jgi:alpha-L-fucosidase
LERLARTSRVALSNFVYAIKKIEDLGLVCGFEYDDVEIRQACAAKAHCETAVHSRTAGPKRGKRESLKPHNVVQMKTNRREFLLRASLALSTATGAARSNAPAPYGALPSGPQLQWSELEFYNFLHFTVNTFTDQEWGSGGEDPWVFNPTQFDADAIIETLKAAGSKGVILTCKHHDGFCLWPTTTTEHSIKYSPYKNGAGDIVKEVSEAAHRQGLKFGVYLSPWDRNQAAYGTPKYIQIYRQQMLELLTHYGPIFEIWHDGANGGKGFYGGANETRTIDKLHYYDWPNTWKLERQLQPEAAIFSDVGPDVRWVGNEKGIAGETCWATYTPRSADGGRPGSPGDVNEIQSTTGTRSGQFWMPAECDVSLRPGWFWHKSENAKVKTPEDLMNLYFDSVGRGASFLLNVPPDTRGLIYETDAQTLRTFGRKLNSTFGKNLMHGAKLTASNTRGNDPAFSPMHLNDGSRESYWSTDDAVRAPSVTIDLPRSSTFNLVRLREYIQLGQRVDAFAIDVWQNGDWASFGAATSIGLARIIRSQRPVTASRLRLRITEAAACPALSEFAIFRYEG